MGARAASRRLTMITRGLLTTPEVNAALQNEAATADNALFVVATTTALDAEGASVNVAFVQWANTAAGQLLGREPRTVVGSPLSSLISWQVESDEAVVPAQPTGPVLV